MGLALRRIIDIQGCPNATGVDIDCIGKVCIRIILGIHKSEHTTQKRQILPILLPNTCHIKDQIQIMDAIAKDFVMQDFDTVNFFFDQVERTCFPFQITSL